MFSCSKKWLDLEIDKLILKFIVVKRPNVAKAILKENKVTGCTLPDFESYNETTLIKTEV